MNGGAQSDRSDGSVAGEPVLATVLERLGAARLRRTIGLSDGAYGSSLIWFAVAVAFLETVVLQGFNVATGRTIVFLENPLWLVRPALLVGAALATSAILQQYELAVRHSNLLERADAPERFHGLVPAALTGVIVAIGVLFTVVNAVAFLTLPQIYDAGGPARVVRFLLITPFGYVPVLGTFLATYVSVEVLLPRRIETGTVDVDFLDPEGLGGLRPIGELVKYAYYFVMLGLVGFALSTYGPYVLDGVFSYEELSPPGTAVNVLFTLAWAAAVAVMAYGIYVLHRFMRREKREELFRLETQARATLEEPYDLLSFDATDPPEAYTQHRERVAQVTSTKEYPASFTMWTQLVVGVLIPKAIQVVLAAV